MSATYAKIFRERFLAEADLFSAAQEARLAAIKDKCLELARSVRLVAAIEESDAALLYTIAFDELREVMTPGRLGARAAACDVLPADRSRRRRVASSRCARRSARRAAVERTELALATARSREGEQETRVLRLSRARPAPSAELHEVVLTRIVDPVRRRPLGALAIGFPLVESRLTGTSTLVRSALWVGGELHSRALSEAARRQVSGELARRTATASGEWRTAIGGVPQQVLFRALPRGAGFPLAEQVSLYSLAEPLAEEARLRRFVLAFGALGLAVALVLSLQISHGLSVPLRELVAATAEIQRGNFSIQVPVRAADEVGRLAASFNEMAAGLALKERYRSLLDLVADKQVAHRALERRPRARRRAARGERALLRHPRLHRAHASSMAPAEVIELLNEHMTAMTAVVYAHRRRGRQVRRRPGDGAVRRAARATATTRSAPCGARARHGRGARADSTRRRAIASRSASASPRARWWPAAWAPTDRLNYTVLGERVNLAARLCAAAGPMEILVDETTYLRLGGELGADAAPRADAQEASAAPRRRSA